MRADVRRSGMLLFAKIAAGIAALYLMVVVLVALAQDRLLFPRWAVARGPALPAATAERLTLSLASGDELVGVHLPAEPYDRPRDFALMESGFCVSRYAQAGQGLGCVPVVVSHHTRW